MNRLTTLPKILAMTTVIALAFVSNQATAALIAGFDPERHNRFLADGTPNPGFLMDEAMISGVGLSPAVLITPLHYLSATHIGSGALNPQFRGSDGVVRTYESGPSGSSVQLTTNLPGGGTAPSDLQLHRLKDPIPSEHGVQPLALIGGSTDDLIGREFFVTGQANQAGRNVIDDVVIAQFTGGVTPSFVIQYSFDSETNGGRGSLGVDEAGLLSGDSGRAALLRVGDEFVVLGTHFGIDLPEGEIPNLNVLYNSFSTIITPYLKDITALTSADGYSISVVAVPEPSSVLLGSLACVMILSFRYRRKPNRD